MSTIEDRIREAVIPLVATLDLEIYDVEHAGDVLRITVDAPGGVVVEALGRATRAISDLLDRLDPIPSAYTLEVSSPGVERALRTAAHFARAIGDPVKVKTVAGVEGERRFDAIVAGADDDGATFTLPDGAARRLAYDEIERARTVFVWPAAPKPGGKGAPKRKKSADGRDADDRSANERAAS